jgi:hypothetical protein
MIPVAIPTAKAPAGNSATAPARRPSAAGGDGRAVGPPVPPANGASSSTLRMLHFIS